MWGTDDLEKYFLRKVLRATISLGVFLEVSLGVCLEAGVGVSKWQRPICILCRICSKRWHHVKFGHHGNIFGHHFWPSGS